MPYYYRKMDNLHTFGYFAGVLIGWVKVKKKKITRPLLKFNLS